MPSGAVSGLADAGVEADVADELAGCREALDAPDSGHHRRGGGGIDARDRDQASHVLGGEHALGDRAIDHRELIGEEVDLAQAAIERVAFIDWQHQRRHPPPASPAEEIADLRARDQVARQDRGDLVLGAGALANELRAA